MFYFKPNQTCLKIDSNQIKVFPVFYLHDKKSMLVLCNFCTDMYLLSLFYLFSVKFGDKLIRHITLNESFRGTRG